MTLFLSTAIRNFKNLSNLRLPANIYLLFLIGGLIGLARNAMHTIIDFPPLFYSYDLDLQFAMFFFVTYLFLFGATLICLPLRVLGYKNIRIEAIFALLFYIQFVNLLVPALDVVGFWLGMPLFYFIGPNPYVGPWYVHNILFMTPGIVMAWVAITSFMIITLRISFSVSWIAMICTAAVIVLGIIIPTYFLWPGMNTLFNLTFSSHQTNMESFRSMMEPYYIHWGYGIFYMVTSVLGLLYYLYHDKSTPSA